MQPSVEGWSPRRGSVAQVLCPILVFVGAALVLLQVSRLGLVAWQWGRVAAVHGLPEVLLQGLRFDLVAIGLGLLLPTLLLPPLYATPWTLRLGRVLLPAVLAVELTAFLLLELATPAFLREYDTRPNFLFVEYLGYPREVLATLWGEYPLQLIMLAVALPVGLIASFRLLARRGGPPSRVPAPLALLLTLVLPVLSLGAARSTLAHRPVNPSTACFSGDPMVNALPLPSLYSVAYAAYELRKREGGAAKAYGDMPYGEVIDEVREASGVPAEAFTSPAIPTLHTRASAHPRSRPLNLVVILEESLGAEFVGALGGPPLTPHLDTLLDEGLALDRLYATGTRSVRGIEAIVTGFLPTPMRSVVKRPRAQRGFFTIAELLRRQGYATSFLYGGGADFDNMARFFTGNGFERIVDQDDFEHPSFVGSWGVSDQDLFRRAHAEFEAMGKRPFFSLVFSSSNHSPWEFPAGEIELYEQPAATRHNAVKYADHALGEFFDLARASSYWKDTLFLVVADHNARVYGAELVPVERFHVPALFLGAGVQPEHVATLASQIDLLPTALSLIGIDAAIPALGRDLSDLSERALPGRAILQYQGTHLLLEEQRAVALREDLPPAWFGVRGERLEPCPEQDRALARRALALALWPQESYRRGDYRLP